MGIRYIARDGDLCPIVSCDYCGRRIDQGKDGRIIYRWHLTDLCQVGNILFYHVKCVPPRAPYPTAKEIEQGHGVAELWDSLDTFAFSLAWNCGTAGPGLIELMSRVFECVSRKEYDDLKDVPRRIHGVYIIHTEQGIKYIGQSQACIRKRLEHHRKHKFSFGDVSKITVLSLLAGKDKTEALEAALICLLHPVFNVQWNQGS